MNNIESIQKRLRDHVQSRTARKERQAQQRGRLCSIEGCGRKHAARDYCTNHYCQLVRIYPGESAPRGLRNPAGYGRKGEGAEPLTEPEFVQLKELRENGVDVRDAAWELEKGYTAVKIAWEYPSYFRYKNRSYDED